MGVSSPSPSVYFRLQDDTSLVRLVLFRKNIPKLSYDIRSDVFEEIIFHGRLVEFL